MKVSLTLVSRNAKIGPIAASMSSSDTCPKSCPFIKAGCYAKQGPISWHWKALDNSLIAMTWDAFCKAVSRLPRGSLFRHNTAGDLPSKDGDSESIDSVMLAALVKAARNIKGFTYTHKGDNPANHEAIKAANAGSFTVNLSANTLEHADRLAALGIGPVAVVLPSTVDGNQIRSMATPEGRKVVICPATYRGVNCASCRLCSRQDRSCIVGFPAHGMQFKKVDVIAMQAPAALAA